MTFAIGQCEGCRQLIWLVRKVTTEKRKKKEAEDDTGDECDAWSVSTRSMASMGMTEKYNHSVVHAASIDNGSS